MQKSKQARVSFRVGSTLKDQKRFERERGGKGCREGMCECSKPRLTSARDSMSIRVDSSASSRPDRAKQELPEICSNDRMICVFLCIFPYFSSGQCHSSSIGSIRGCRLWENHAVMHQLVLLLPASGLSRLWIARPCKGVYPMMWTLLAWAFVSLGLYLRTCTRG